MAEENFINSLFAIWPVFADTYLNHKNAPCSYPDRREQSLVNLLKNYLCCSAINTLDINQLYHKSIITKLTNICDLLELWSSDLDLIYQVREESSDSEFQVRQIAKKFLQRIQSFNDCTVIPNGLISAERTQNNHEYVSLAILTKQNGCINWIQVDPGSSYHQHYKNITGDESNSFLEITNINPNVINEEWLYLLIGLKSVSPGTDFYYKDVSLYECILSHLNGETHFQPHINNDFVKYSHTTPAHTWFVVQQSFRYFIKYFFGDAGFEIYNKLITGFKLFLTEKVFNAFKSNSLENNQMQQCKFLLQEMCRDVANQALHQGNSQQKDYSSKLIHEIKKYIDQYCNILEIQLRKDSQLDNPKILSLSFISPCIKNYTSSSSRLQSPNLQIRPTFVRPSINDDIIHYLRQIKLNFIQKLLHSKNIKEIALLSYGIEEFFIEFLVETNILANSINSFSNNDEYLASVIKEFAEIYYGCQCHLVEHLSNLPYQPQFYAKNLIIQFFAYATIASLNYRDQNIGPLLSKFNLDTSFNESLSLNTIIPQLLIEDARWLKALFITQEFFKPKNDKETLFSFKRFVENEFKFYIRNEADLFDVDVRFASLLLENYPELKRRFDSDFLYLPEFKVNRKWRALAYSDSYLPSLYTDLVKIAYTAKSSLTGFRNCREINSISTNWCYSDTPLWYRPVSFNINDSAISTNTNFENLSSYLLNSNEEPYERLITTRKNIGSTETHLLENQIIASQDKKPESMDCIRYMQLGFLQSEPLIKFERLYIALRNQQLDFTCEQESILIKQTLFEISKLIESGKKSFSLLEWTAHHNPKLFHALGLLCIEKVCAMQYRLTQHFAIGEILEVIQGLLTFYPPSYKGSFIKGIKDIYYLLKKILSEPSTHLSKDTLLYLNAYLIINLKPIPDIINAEMLTVLKSLLAIQNFKAEGIVLKNNCLLQVYITCFTLHSQFEYHLERDLNLFHEFMSSVVPNWNRLNTWEKSQSGFLFTCGKYSVTPLTGNIYFLNQPIERLPDNILEHNIYKECLGLLKFSVIPSSYEVNSQEISCYLSINRKPQVRLTLIQDTLLIEEWVVNEYQRYISPKELLGHSKYSKLLYELPQSKENLYHWLNSNNKIFIKDQQRRTLYEWNLENNYLFSSIHQKYVVPWEQLKSSHFKTWLKNVELPDWIEIFAVLSINSCIFFDSLHFWRLSLNFDFREGQFISRQIHGYTLSKIQHINTLHGFSNYLVLERKEPNLDFKHIKVIIPHRKIAPIGSFYMKTVLTNLDEVRTPAYFIYDYDSKSNLLKTHHKQAQLYLVLIYYCSASLDEYDLSNCDSYHLARENLEACWTDQPYNMIELDIFKQLLNCKIIRDYHTHRVALYLKIVSLLINSLRLEFLYTDEVSQTNKEISYKLLEECDSILPQMVSIYIKHKSSISSRIRLTFEEEEDVVKRCFSSFKFYYQLNFKQQSQVIVSPEVKTFYKDHYRQLFDKQTFQQTSFLNIFQENISLINFTYDIHGVNFSSGINGIFLNQFVLDNFITLYDIAKKSHIKFKKYLYLLHHMVLRTKIDYLTFPSKLVLMLAQALLLVAEKPALFPESPNWFNENVLQISLSKRTVSEVQILENFPSFTWAPSISYSTNEERKEALDEAKEADQKENKQIWYYFSKNDLNEFRIPLCLPVDPSNFSLQYESLVNCYNHIKRDVVRKLYLEAAYNDAMYNFFVCILNKCEELKFNSIIGWEIAPFNDNPIKIQFPINKKPCLSTPESTNLEKWLLPSEPLIKFNEFFTVKAQQEENRDFIFETELTEIETGYQCQFLNELKTSWSVYREKDKYSYSWVDVKSASVLEMFLQKKYEEINKQARETWNNILSDFKKKPNSEFDNYFFLRYYSGDVSHYHKGDILALLIYPNKIFEYNPDCLKKKDEIIQEILNYVINEINSAKIIRVLSILGQYKQTEIQNEKFSLLQDLVKSLQENVDTLSYRFPHWFLFQLENEIIVRKNQIELITNMLNQTEKAMYQLNMGEGKTSVILPLLSYNLANGQQVLRVIVLQPLLATMKNFLRQRFSGMITKRIYMLPFHRDTDISTENIYKIYEMIQKCQNERGILLVTPEHCLSLKLKIRELILEYQEQKTASNIFNWNSYRQRVPPKIESYENLSEETRKQFLERQSHELRTCLCNEGYIDSYNNILKAPISRQEYKIFEKFKEVINDQEFKEWSCLKAAYQELICNSKLSYDNNNEKLDLLNKINLFNLIDLLDESDEILKHGTELNYSMGDKYNFDGGELRWQIPQFFLKIIFCDLEMRQIIKFGKSDGSTVINEHFNLCGGVPFIQFLSEIYYESSIKPFLIDKFFIENLPTLKKFHINDADKNLIAGEKSTLRQYISAKLDLSTEKKIIDFLTDKGQLKEKLLIAKGWLSHGILFHILNAKYRVHYGLNLNMKDQIPKRIAIPFLGKDTPSTRSEFSHPDAMLGFTIISYLYEGLNEKMLKKALMKLKEKFSNQMADVHLKNWADASRKYIESQEGLYPPLLLTSLRYIDLADQRCLLKLHNFLSANYLAIFFYLDQFVLIEEALQYKFKISANAHTLVGYNSALGFSGTDDRKITMPFQIKSLRSTSQEGTNGKLLSVLTQERNSRYYSLEAETTEDLLKQLCNYVKEEENCHALIDAGALITGLSNYEVASFLLNNLSYTFLGILYFSDDENSLSVLTRDKKIMLLQDCYLDKRCLFAYLDDIHTRGTDIKLPLNSHAILTIAIGMQKDKLMQAAMRLRQLAQKQSVSLWGTQAVTLAIQKDNSIDATEINSLEVIKWVTRNTVNHINKDLFSVSLRKIDFQFLKQAEFWLKEVPVTLNSLVQYCKEKELYLLEEFYALSPRSEDLRKRLYLLVEERIKLFWQQIDYELQIRNLQEFDPITKKAFETKLLNICEELAPYLQEGYIHCSLDNNQEKEMEIEIVQEQRTLVQKIENRIANSEIIWDVEIILKEDFISFAEANSIIMPIKKIENFVSEPVNIKNIIWHPDIYMSRNYILSVYYRCNSTDSLDNFLRPVDIILIHRIRNKNSKAILLSGQEVNTIKSKFHDKLHKLENNLIIHINDIDGPTKFPVDKDLSKEEYKLLTIIKLFAGECNYTSMQEVQRIAKRVGRLYPHYFTCPKINLDNNISNKIYDTLIQEDYLNFAGVMNDKILNILSLAKSGNTIYFELPYYQDYRQYVIEKLYKIYNKLIIKPISPLKDHHKTLWQWIGTRGRLKEYSDSALESVLNLECHLKASV